MQALCCPVCGGNGIKDEGFYRSTSGMWTSSGIRRVTCRSCNGKGYVVVDTTTPRWVWPVTTDTCDIGRK